MKRRNKKIRYYGGKPSNIGYQFGVSPNLQGQQYLKATDMNPQADALRNTIIPRAIGSLSASIPGVNNAFSNYTSLNNAIGSLSNLVGTKVTEQQAANLANAGIGGLQAGSEITQNTLNNLGAKGAKALGAKVGMNALGYVTAAASALQGGIGLAQDIGNWNNDRVTGTDLQNASGKSTGVINGRLYDRYESFDEAGTDRYVKQMNTRDTISTIGNAMATSASIGSIGGPVGAAIGGGVGFIGGLIGSLLGSSSRNDAYEEAKRNWNTTRNAYNLQQEAAAASLGIGDEFYDGRYGAVRGKTSNGDMYKKGSRNSHIEIGPIETDEGVKFGPIRSNVSVGESIVNFEKGTAHYIKGKSSRRGKDLEHSDEAPGTSGFIAGFVPNPITGNYIADDAKPHAEKIENNNQLKEYAMNETKGTTQDVLLSQIEKDNNQHFAALKWLEGIQDDMNNKKDILAMGNYKRGKHSYATGKSFLEGAAEFAPYAVQAMFPLAELAHYKGTPIRVQDTYAANPYIEDAAKAMKSARYDSYNQHQQVNDEKRQALYDIVHSAVNPAAKIGLLAKLHAQSSGQHSAIEANAQNEKNKRLVDYANFIANAGGSDSQMRNSANESIARRTAEAQGVIDKGVGSALLGFSNIPLAVAKHMNQLKMFNQSTDIYKRMARIYDAQAAKYPSYSVQ